jgi:hypothetical protein
MGKKKKAFHFNFIQVGNCSDEVARDLYKTAVREALAKIGVVAYNLDEVATKYISEEARNSNREGSD